MENLLTLIGKIKEIKNEQKITNIELSKLSGVPLGTLNKILSGATLSVKSNTLTSIAKALKVDISMLCGNDSEDSKDSYQTSYGYVKVGAYTPEIKVCDVSYNVNSIIEGIDKAYKRKVKVLVFPELCITGATCGDMFLQRALLDSALDGLMQIKKYSECKNMLIFVGLPIKNEGAIYNSACCLYNGKILGFTVKSNTLKSDDNRWFNSGSSVSGTIRVCGENYEISPNIVYKNSHNDDVLIKAVIGNDIILSDVNEKASIIVNLCADCEVVGANEYRETLIKSQSSVLNCGYVFANAGYGESTGDVVFAGGNIIAEKGKILEKSQLFTTGLIISDIDVSYLSFERSKRAYNGFSNDTEVFFDMQDDFCEIDRTYSKLPFVPTDATQLKNRCELILSIQANALLKRIKHINCKTLVLGVSGGLDSTLALLVCKRAITLAGRDSKDIIAVTMPCFGTTSRTKNNAVIMSEVLGVTLKEINIKDAVRVHFKDIGHDETITDVTYENAQARERTQVLMDIANMTGGIVIGTGDLSELALGWATYNGDHMSMYGVNAGVPKTLLRSLVRYEADRLGKDIKRVLYDVLDTPVSPELLPPSGDDIAQKTEDIVGPYLLHDFYIYYAINKGFKPSKIFYIAKRTFNGEFSDEVLYKWLLNFYNRFFAQQFKRSCLPDGAKIGSLSFSPRGDLKMPSDGIKKQWISDLERVKP